LTNEKLQELRDTEKYPLTNEEYMCLVIRECNTRSWSGENNPTHRRDCRFCAEILFSARELRDRGMILNEQGQPVPREGKTS